jgi:hypothetical protein
VTSPLLRSEVDHAEGQPIDGVGHLAGWRLFHPAAPQLPVELKRSSVFVEGPIRLSVLRAGDLGLRAESELTEV